MSFIRLTRSRDNVLCFVNVDHISFFEPESLSCDKGTFLAIGEQFGTRSGLIVNQTCDEILKLIALAPYSIRLD